MDLSIVILNYKQQGLVKQCIRGIVTARPQLSYELIVVDNNSGDNCLEMVKSMFDPRVINDPNQPKLPLPESLSIPKIVTIDAKSNGGFAVGNNIGISAAAGKYVMILNPDIAVVPGAIETMFKYMEQNENVGILGPKLTNPDGSVQYSCRRFPNFLTPLFRRTILGNLTMARKWVGSYLMQDFDHHKTREVDWLFGACLFIRKSVLEKVGSFDENFFMYFEDLDLCRRVWEAGFKVVYVVNTEMVHYHSRLSAERSGILGVFSRGGRIHLISGLKYFLKYWRKPWPVNNL
ncbi:MAG: glycosyltransferase family 2 protein [Patescibacteria group bacterium]|nr:glycosyltransferase family 2 protein [Patescibacteria group bacterium]